MNKKKLTTILGLSAAVANLGYSSIVLAQTTDITGEQTINCDTNSAQFVDYQTAYQGGNASYYGISDDELRIEIPENFYFPSANVSNDYQADTTVDLDEDEVNLLIEPDLTTPVTRNIGVESNSVEGCANHGVQVQVAMSQYFQTADATPVQLRTENSPNSYANLSLYTPENGYCDDTADTSFPEGICDDLTITNSASPPTNLAYVNSFDGTANDGTLSTSFETDAALAYNDATDPANHSLEMPTITLYSDTDGFDGYMFFPNVRYFISLPKGVQAGTYTSEVTWTISQL
ncbi:hypothetical protein GF376_00400 [Candidatus Peregrinibacteria bacterium]|nr:hypothetical protein [Candidatus Peregrinibacteria bacterium]